MPARRNKPHPKAHDWVLGYEEPVNTEVWRCTKCGFALLSSTKPQEYRRFDPHGTGPNGNPNALLCDELVAWRVMDS